MNILSKDGHERTENVTLKKGDANHDKQIQ